MGESEQREKFRITAKLKDVDWRPHPPCCSVLLPQSLAESWEKSQGEEVLERHDDQCPSVLPGDPGLPSQEKPHSSQPPLAPP